MTSDPPVPPDEVEASEKEASEETPEKEWWDDPGLPWKHKPTRSDLACLTWIGVISIYSLAMLPLRPVMLGWTPQVLASLGSWTGAVMTGALAATGDPWWPLVLGLGTLGGIKFHWVYWWAGKLWGRGLIEVWSGKSERARRRNERAEKFAHKYETLALALTFLPIPIPYGVVNAALGAAGTSLRKFLIIIVLASFISTGGYMYLGYRLGEPAVAAVKQYSQYLWYLSLALLVGTIIYLVWKSRQDKAGAAEPR